MGLASFPHLEPSHEWLGYFHQNGEEFSFPNLPASNREDQLGGLARPHLFPLPQGEDFSWPGSARCD